jgi:hypothetical protein
MEHTSIESGFADWQRILQRIQNEPLQMCPQFPQIAAQWQAWWRYETSRPLLLAHHPTEPDIRWDKAFDLLDQPEQWLEVRRRQLESSRYYGEAVPHIRVDIGPVATAAFVGAPLHFALSENTSWQETIIASWQEHPPLQFDPGNERFSQVMQVIRRLCEDARSRYLVCLPDLSGPIDVLANLRGSEQLCFDLLEHRQAIISRAMQLVEAWEQVFTRMYDLVLGCGAGIAQWIDCWSDRPYTVPTCDFNALIGPEDFCEVCLPSYKEQARRAGLCVFHLDGPDAARHATALAQDPDITAVQYTPGAGTPSALAKVPMFKMFQEHRKPLFIDCPAEQTVELCESLEPAGLAIRIQGHQSQQQLQQIIQWRDQNFG